MFILPRDQNPVNSIYYISGIIYNEILIINNEEINVLYKKIKENFKKEISFSVFALGLDFLFLMDLIECKNEYICLKQK